ncbi:hypothetical protein DsansV1_C20g0163271 [Dioscorea sansibarensis]
MIYGVYIWGVSTMVAGKVEKCAGAVDQTVIPTLVPMDRDVDPV